MPYSPGVQDISGQLLARGIESAAQARAQGIGAIGSTISNLFGAYQQKRAQDEEFMAKAKSMENFIKTHADDFAPVDPQTGQKNSDAVLQFLQQSPDENAKQKYMRLGTFLDTAVTGTKMQQAQAAIALERAKTEQAKLDLAEQQKAAEWMNQFGGMGIAPQAAAQPAAVPLQPSAAPVAEALVNIPATAPEMIANAPKARGEAQAPVAAASKTAPAVPPALAQFSPAAKYPAPARGPLAPEAPETVKEPTVADAVFLARQLNMGRVPSGAQTAHALDMLQKRYDANVKGVGLTERDKAYKILEDAFIQNNEGRKPNSQEKSELLQRAATIGTVGFGQGIPMMNPDGSFAGFTVTDKKTGDVKLFVPGQEGLNDIPKGATPSTQGAFVKNVLPMDQFQKLKREVTDDEISLDRYSKYLQTIGGSRQGLDLLADQVAEKTKTLFNNGKLTQEQMNAAIASGQLQGLIGAMRLNTVGGGVMTEKDAERVISRLGGNVGALQNKEQVQRAIADVYAEKYRRYQDSLGFYNSAVKNYYGNQGFTEAKPVEFDPKMIQSGSEMFGLSEDEKKLMAIRKRKAELEAKAKGGK